MKIFSGIQPTGELTLGNLFGAVRQWVDLQKPENDCTYCVVDYHAITAEYDREELAPRTLAMARDLLACGIDPEKSILFVQSQVPEHLELSWIFSSVAGYGELARMTQFKEKGERQNFISVGLFAYPILQAADILVHKAAGVPVGKDQVQHLELTRDIARRFNQRYGETFPETQPILGQVARVMSPADPSKKMSKSLGPKHYVGVFEDEKPLRKKIRSHVTDAGATERDGAIPAGVENLLALLDAAGAPEQAASMREAECAGNLMYSELKQAVADRLVQLLEPIRERRDALNTETVREILADGAARARRTARAVVDEARERIGLLSA